MAHEPDTRGANRSSALRGGARPVARGDRIAGAGKRTAHDETVMSRAPASLDARASVRSSRKARGDCAHDALAGRIQGFAARAPACGISRTPLAFAAPRGNRAVAAQERVARTGVTRLDLPSALRDANGKPRAHPLKVIACFVPSRRARSSVRSSSFARSYSRRASSSWRHARRARRRSRPTASAPRKRVRAATPAGRGKAA